MSELKTYYEWELIFKQEHEQFNEEYIGFNLIKSENIGNKPMSKDEAWRYHSMNSIFGRIFNDCKKGVIN